MRNHDLKFLKRFSMVIVFLAVVTLILIGIAAHLNKSIPEEVSPTAEKKKLDRIAPVGAVYAGDTGAAAQAAALAAQAAKASSKVAYGGTLDGKVIFDSLCGACHKSGTGGAPMLVKSAWGSRIAQGKDTMYKHAVEGFKGAAGIMPAKGGNASLTEEQVHATVDWMVSNLQ